MDLGKGSRFRTDKTAVVVSRWHIPNGCEYDIAKAIYVFFEDEEAGNEYAKHYAMPPEMADVMSISVYDKLLASSSKNYASYKQRFLSDFGEHNAPALPCKRV